MYLTYNEYVEYGGTKEETAFDQLEFEARTVIDYWTFNRLQKNDEYSEAVKRCMYKLITLIDLQNTNEAGGTPDEVGIKRGNISSESNDGVSTVYNTLTAKETIDVSQKEMETTIRRYLNGVKNSLGQRVLYRGIYPNE